MKSIIDEKAELSLFGFEDETMSKLYALLDVNNYSRHARAQDDLVNEGKNILPVMHQLMLSDFAATRKAAIKVIELIAHKSSIKVAIETLEDSDSEVRWIATRTLIAIGRSSIKPILRALVIKGTSYYLRQGAHHVLRELIKENDSEELKQLVHFMKTGIEVPEKIPFFASNILKPGSG